MFSLNTNNDTENGENKQPWWIERNNCPINCSFNNQTEQVSKGDYNSLVVKN